MKVIAEIGTSHQGSLEKAKSLIDAAADAGADGVKLQWVYADEILHPNTGFVSLPGGKTRLYDRFKSFEVEPSFYARAADYARNKNLDFICSPFGLKSLKELLALEPDGVKIASPELNHLPLLQALADYQAGRLAQGKAPLPVIVSSGVSRLSDIESALDILTAPFFQPEDGQQLVATGTDSLTLLHCITSYPAPEREYNLRLLESLRGIFGLETGVSDHSLDPVLVPTLATALGGRMIEKHITLSKATDGLDDPVALEPEQFAHLCYCVGQCKALLRRYGQLEGKKLIIQQMKDQYGDRLVEETLGSGIKRLAPSEKANYGRTNRSLHFMRAMKKGDVITSDDIAILRTEKVLSPGISPCYEKSVIGLRLTRDVENGEGLEWAAVTERC